LLRHVALFFVLLGFWVLLSGQVDVRDPTQRYLLICGAASALLGTLLARRVGFLYDEGRLGRIILRLPPYLIWLAWQVVLANLDVARRVWSLNPRKHINPGFIKAPYEIKTPLAKTIYANSVTLTPGTVTVRLDAHEKVLLVHTLTGIKPEELRVMHDRVKALEEEV
jgi:multicomponent Na+:H+ antiporter subunit E